jgi:hypothetical protein
MAALLLIGQVGGQHSDVLGRHAPLQSGKTGHPGE